MKFSAHPNPLLPARREFSEEYTRRPHSYTVTENDRIFAAELPLQRQHGNKRPHQEGGTRDADRPFELRHLPGIVRNLHAFSLEESRNGRNEAEVLDSRYGSTWLE